LNKFLEINYVSHRNKNMNMVLLLSISLTWNHIYVFILKRHIWLSRLGHQYLLKWSTIRQLFRPWTNFHIHLSRHVKALVYAVTTATLGNGTNLPFWSDRWLAGQSIADLAPAVVATVSPRVIKCRSVASALPENSWIRDIAYLRILGHLMTWQSGPSQANKRYIFLSSFFFLSLLSL
jgi:hypothetical protein